MEARMRVAQLDRKQRPEDETVSWLNRIVEIAWPIISSDYFGPFVDLLEDSLMQHVPPIVHSCRIDGLDQGTVPMRLLSFKLLPSTEESFTGVDMDDMDDSDRIFANESDLDEYVVMEVRFSYRRPTKRGRRSDHGAAVSSGSSRKDDIGADAIREGGLSQKYVDKQRIQMLMYMSVGVQKLASVDFPVGVEVIGIEGTMRIRLKMSPMLPFIRDMSFNFVGMPKVELSAHPLGNNMMIDVMNLPLISNYVLYSVENVLRDFVAPKSYTVDVQSLFGDGIGPQNSAAIGLLVVVFHRAVGLASADASGKSDPFVTLSYPMAKKPMYITRVIRKTINPVWQEIAVIPVTADNAATYQRLRFSVFDADRFSADDPLGRVDISFIKLLQRARERFESDRHGIVNSFETYWEHLVPARRGSKAKGHLMFSIGYFERHTAKEWELVGKNIDPVKAEDDKFEIATKDKLPSPDDPMYTMMDRIMLRLGLGVDPNIIRARLARHQRIAKFVSRIQAGIEATNSAPSPHFAAGVLSFHIHSIEGLEVLSNTASLRGTTRTRHHKLVIPHASNPETAASDMLPSSYVHVILNDTTVYRTRTKRSDAKPFINAGSERFIANWATTRIDFCVRQQRQREDDPVIGVASVALAHLFTNTCRVKRWFPLVGGIGAGQISLTLLFQPFEVSIPRPLQGWDIGVLELFGCRVISLDEEPVKPAWINFDTVSGSASTPTLTPGSDTLLEWADEMFLRIAVQYRYQSFLYIELRTESRVPGRTKCLAQTVVHLDRLIDGERTIMRLPFYRRTDWLAMEQAYLTQSCVPQSDACDDGKLAETMPVLDDIASFNPQSLATRLRPIGWMEMDVAFMPGITNLHRSLVPGDRNLRTAYKSFLALADFGMRPRRAQRPDEVSGDWQTMTTNADDESVTERDDGNDDDDENVDDDRDGDEVYAVPQHNSADDDGLERTSSIQSDRRAGNMQTRAEVSADDYEGSEYSSTTDSRLRGRSSHGSLDQLLASRMEEISGRRAHSPGWEFDDECSPTERRHELHRQHRGLAQFKLFRSASWVKGLTKDGAVIARRRLKSKHSPSPRIESEKVSHF
ncbi:hypothetical protein MCUN1_001356 [Malassezia cuniculi]|uniref:C2 domain-containing protein n=1 Tax=Malassezia cuniculi TaxID=948313 RepID=A0AAF0J5Y0_9BASI|nr:hypothetical protein MCUN1_001356 [Malassezia cuniculi]